MSKISILLPAYNAEKYIKKSIESVLNSSYINFELIVLNDGSTDNTENIVRTFRDNRIRLINNLQNKGIIKSLNLGIMEANGDFIARMDADDISHPRRFELQVKTIIKDNLDIISSSAVTTNKIIKRTIGTEANADELKLALAFYNPIIHPLVMARSEIFKLNMYDENYQHAEDYELWTRLMLSGAKFRTTADILLTYRIHANQISKSKSNFQKETRDRIAFKYLTEVNSEGYWEASESKNIPKNPLAIMEKFVNEKYIDLENIRSDFIDKIFIELLLEGKIKASIYNIENMYHIFKCRKSPKILFNLICGVLQEDSLLNTRLTWRIINRLFR